MLCQCIDLPLDSGTTAVPCGQSANSIWPMSSLFLFDVYMCPTKSKFDSLEMFKSCKILLSFSSKSYTVGSVDVTSTKTAVVKTAEATAVILVVASAAESPVAPVLSFTVTLVLSFTVTLVVMFVSSGTVGTVDSVPLFFYRLLLFH